MLKNLIIAAATVATLASANLAMAEGMDKNPRLQQRHWHHNNMHWNHGPFCHKVWVKHHHRWVKVLQCRPWFGY